MFVCVCVWHFNIDLAWFDFSISIHRHMSMVGTEPTEQLEAYRMQGYHYKEQKNTQVSVEQLVRVKQQGADGGDA